MTLTETLERAVAFLKRMEKDVEADKEPILIWPFDQAPEAYRLLSQNGGDEDWVAFVPAWIWEKTDGWIPFLEPGTPFGVAHVERHPVPGGVVLIGCHA